ncbi:carbohydrate ABC transporter permease [Corynebacterium bovis]|uniref:sn-glycerol 3-phosphate transport system permease protein n=1 Tax=Corynebacterium bovis DSM 20582 = CIP 54.80 TaxID=927655 RepID=A0A8I0CM61_9CORY|nr:carbohydrate ABC transporter permease [Corynebacterium bovis]MBB3115318.1 sn-glycerol 3-phosphate transport system permease protein [Corynebacterium bovis DSM 20582 = CIP 54.80]QQC48212.1 carbohydrate ABC transporter permease [Corynebacterium bovis]RRO80347.1 carbohydrate ABC transporter permease [Corynebacterium bovis]RRO92698.1 carbohydrate ABC transporter permease [Corynebacterium bovis]RRO95231.1 carbohydrate ABC transporter permease [Corynebacterium bovis]
MTTTTTTHPTRKPPRPARRPRRSRVTVGTVLTVVWLTLTALAVAAPVIYAVLGALHPTTALTGGIGGLVGDGWTLENIRNAWDRSSITDQLLNSVTVTVVQTAAQFVTAVLAAYALVFGRMRFTGVIAVALVVPMMLPQEVNILGNFLTVRQLGLYDQVPAIFLPFLANALTIFLFIQAFRRFPTEIHEAARLEGVGPLRFLVQFVLPLNAPVCMTALITSAVAAWNGYMWPLLVTMSDEVRTIQPGLKSLSSENSSDTGMVLAGLLLASLPMLVLVLLGQRHLSRGLTEGAVK